MSNNNKPSPNQQPYQPYDSAGNKYGELVPQPERFHEKPCGVDGCPICYPAPFGSGKSKVLDGTNHDSADCKPEGYCIKHRPNSGKAKGVSEDSKPEQLLPEIDDIRAAEVLSGYYRHKPKEPTKSQSFEDELHQILKEMSVETVRTWLDASRNQAATVRVWLKAEAAIKATVEKHYQIKEEE